ncbi:MAG TPA: nuclear transport factor 2 family protein [Bacteroidia bacterium]|nr:nuclear transport factor 2 family protein [Bacteroidia bacterium]
MRTASLLHFTKKILATGAVLIICFNATVFAQNEVDAVKKLLHTYNSAMQKLDTIGTAELFADSSLIVESGNVEGTYQQYEVHHIGPELSEFKSFKYSGYKANVVLDGDYAFATEIFKYKIVGRKSKKVSERNAVTTSVLKKIRGEWKITVMHLSSHK